MQNFSVAWHWKLLFLRQNKWSAKPSCCTVSHPLHFSQVCVYVFHVKFDSSVGANTLVFSIPCLLLLQFHSPALPKISACLAAPPVALSARVRLNGSCVIRDSRRDFEFSWLNSLLSWPFSWQDKKINVIINGCLTFK